ncbi:MAG TPA: aminoglycoside phosphotransferase [Planctomycetaceae bacterium]|nr:aminoglycoside phosphotransferase [Planctomycetaceae bacterium]
MAGENPKWLDSDTPLEIERLLRNRGHLESGETICKIEPAGDGNMNVTLRVWLQASQVVTRSLIVKQSRPFVAKYDFIPAPQQRIGYEAKFYRFVTKQDVLSGMMPQLIDWIEPQLVLILEDVGQAVDATDLYARSPEQADWSELLDPLVDWLTRLHVASAGHYRSGAFQNAQLRRLNYEHIFVLPFREQPAVDLDAVTPGLTEASHALRTDAEFAKRVLQLGSIYLQDGPCLLHGDYYPGSWLRARDGVKVIDPEFAFVGYPEFDWSVLVGHLKLCGVEDALDQVRERCDSESVEWTLVESLAGVEVLRRLLGVAQLPLPQDLEAKNRLMLQATQAIQEGWQREPSSK